MRELHVCCPPTHSLPVAREELAALCVLVLRNPGKGLLQREASLSVTKVTKSLPLRNWLPYMGCHLQENMISPLWFLESSYNLTPRHFLCKIKCTIALLAHVLHVRAQRDDHSTKVDSKANSIYSQVTTHLP